MAVHRYDRYTCFCRIPEGLAKVRVGFVVGVEVFHIRHLNHKQHIGTVTLFRRLSKLTQVLCAAFRGSIREGADATAAVPRLPEAGADGGT